MSVTIEVVHAILFQGRMTYRVNLEEMPECGEYGYEVKDGNWVLYVPPANVKFIQQEGEAPKKPKGKKGA